MAAAAAAAAAAAWSRSRGVAGVRSTNGLFFMFTLLCLVGLTSSLIDKNQLEKDKERLQTAEQEMDRLKAERAFISELMHEFMTFMDQMTAVQKKTLNASPDFLPLVGFLENIKGFMEKTNDKNEKLGVKMQDTEQKLRKLRNLIQFLDENQAEL